MVAQVWDCILGCCCRMSIPPNWHYVRWPCPALPVPLPAGLHACLGQKTTKYIHGRAGAFPSHRKYSTPVRDCTRPGGIARQEESCISLPLLCPPSPSTFSLHDNHIPTIQQYTFDLHSTRSCSLTAISIYHLHFLYLPAPSLFTLPTTSSVAYLELQRSSLPPTTPTTPLVNNRRRLLRARSTSRLFTFQCRPRKAQSGSCRRQKVDSTTISPPRP